MEGIYMVARSADKSTTIFVEKINDLAERNIISAGAGEELKNTAEEAAKEGKKEADAENVAAYFGDKVFYRYVILILGAAVIISLLGGLALAYLKMDIPQFIVAVGTTALGAIAGILAPSPTQKQ
jgi:hypothetical protein